MADMASSEKKKKTSYTVEEKLAIVQAAKTESLRAVAKRFNVDRNCIRSWRDKEAQLAALHPNARRLPGAGRRPSEGSGVKRKATSEIDDVNVKKTATSALIVGFQGKEGAFSDVAARTAFEMLQKEYETMGFGQVGHVLEAIEHQEIDYGVLPLENSISGTFHGILDRLIASNLCIVGEIACVQELCLCALEDTKIEDINCLLSHPAILDHCEAFICALEKQNDTLIDRQATWDSAGACQIVHHEGMASIAAIASEQAAIAHGLKVLEKGVGDELNNETRYVILGRHDAAPLAMGASHRKSSIVIAVPNEPQALFKIVSAFALRNLTILKIESRPAATAGGLFTAQTHHWDYIFYIDYLLSADDHVNRRLRAQLEEFALWIKDLGTYYASNGETKTNVEPPRWKRICNVISC